MPGWSTILALWADYSRDWIWRGTPEKIGMSKFHPYKMHLAINHWTDRSTYFLGRWYDLEAQLILRDLVKPGSTVVDVGANRGMFALAASHIVGPQGHIICFEPNPLRLNILRREIIENKIKNVTIRHSGLGDTRAKMTLTVPHKNPGCGTLAKGLFPVDASYVALVSIGVGDEELFGAIPSLIKIGVEGFEFQALLGLRKTIEQSRPIIMHAAKHGLLKANGHSMPDIADFLEPLNYNGFRLVLEKCKGGHAWILNELDDEDCNAIWFPCERLSEVKSRLR